MDPEESSESTSRNTIYCSFRRYGCSDLIPQNEIQNHYISERHVLSIISFICQQRENHEYALIDHTINPMGVGAVSSRVTSILDNTPRFFEQLTDLIIRNMPLSDIGASSSYNAIANSSRQLILQMDRDPNRRSNLQCHQQQRQFNEMGMTQLSSLLISGSSDQEDQSVSSVNEQITVPSNPYAIAILQQDLDSKPVSTDGCLIWRIPEVSEKINDAIGRKKTFLTSPIFQTSMDGQKLFVRFYLNGDTDPKFISIYVHLNFPSHGLFTGDIKFALVDQSQNQPLQHIIKTCVGQMINVNDSIGLENFIDKNLLHKAENPYIRTDSIYILAYTKQTNQKKYSNLPPNVQHAIMAMEQMG